MSKGGSNRRDGEENAFVKGMTLQQYMAKSQFDKELSQQTPDCQQDNLYQSCKSAEKDQIYHKKRNYRIDQIDQESVQDSKDYHRHQDTLQTPGFEPLQREEHLHQHSQLGRAIKARNNSISMSTAITFKNTQLETNNNLKLKRLSVSPNKKKSEMPVPLPGASITLYGSKFGQSPQPQKQVKMPQMLTFYGKLQLQGEDVIRRKSSVKQSQLKQKFKKKPQYQLNKMFQIDNQTRSNAGYKGYPDLRVQGFGERKTKFI